MREMAEKAPEWFESFGAPRIYRVYSEDAAAARVFRAFEKDESERLKLLFCIDMLNEGVHVEGVDGVILFRPTVSPIIYKQQIGRALCAGKPSASSLIATRPPNEWASRRGRRTPSSSSRRRV